MFIIPEIGQPLKTLRKDSHLYQRKVGFSGGHTIVLALEVQRSGRTGGIAAKERKNAKKIEFERYKEFKETSAALLVLPRSGYRS